MTTLVTSFVCNKCNKRLPRSYFDLRRTILVCKSCMNEMNRDFFKMGDQNYRRLIILTLWWMNKSWNGKEYETSIQTPFLISEWKKIKKGKKYVMCNSRGVGKGYDHGQFQSEVELYYFNYGQPDTLLIKQGNMKDTDTNYFIPEILKKNNPEETYTESEETFFDKLINKPKSFIEKKRRQNILSLETDLEIVHVGKISEIKEIKNRQEVDKNHKYSLDHVNYFNKENTVYSCQYRQKVDENGNPPRITFTGDIKYILDLV